MSKSVLSSSISLISGFLGPATRAARHAEISDAFRRHGPFVYRVLERLGVGAEAADDLVQDVFLVALRRWARYDPREDVRPWLYGIARRLAANHRRSKQRRQNRRKVAATLPEEPGVSFVARPFPDPEDKVAAADASQFIQDFCDSLPPKQRDVFVCVELEGLSGPEAAEALGIRVNTVYTRLRRARQALQARLARIHAKR